MYYQRVQNNGNSRSMISNWYGYNHNYKIGNGEFYDLENMCSDDFPLLRPRKIRPRLAEGDIGGIIVTDNRLTYLDGTTLYYGTETIDVSDILEGHSEWQNLYRFGAYLVMHPACVYINLHDYDDRGTMGARFRTTGDFDITYTICDIEGNEFTKISASDEAPKTPATGDRWLKTLDGEQGLYIYSTDQWIPVPTCYIRIDIPNANLTEYFDKGDTVFMNSIVDDLNNGSKIINMTDESIVVIGVMDNVVKTHKTRLEQMYLERRIPKMDYVCLDKNRMWGCYYGYNDGKMVNEIYCSELGDFKNWYSYQGIASDSYAVTVGVPEKWTGCISYQGHPTFFKENAIFRIYGSMPSEYQVNQIDARGVQNGSSKSLAIVDEYLVYKSVTDICVFDGSSPRSISEQLGRQTPYYDAVAGGCMNKYFVVMQNIKGAKRFFVYDFKNGIWERESKIDALGFTTTENGQIFAATETDIYGLGNTEVITTDQLVTEEWVSWFAETGDMGYEYPDSKYVDRITIRAYVPIRSELKVSISYDDKPFQVVSTVRGKESVGSKSLAINPMRCDHYRIKIEGHGDCVIYSMAITLDTESEEHGY